MKIKFKLRTTILMLSQLVFFIVLAGCGGGEKGGGQPCLLADCEEIDLDVSNQVIEIDEYVESAQKFIKNIGYNQGSNKEFFSSIQAEVLDTTEMVNLLAIARPNLEGPTKKIFGLRVFYTLNLEEKSIKLYYALDSTLNYASTNNREEYLFEFNHEIDNIEIALNKGVRLYESIDNKLQDISKDTTKIAEARRNWNDYKDFIFFDRWTPFGDTRKYDPQNDAASVFYPDEELMALIRANKNNKLIYIVSSLKTEKLTFRHTINFGTIMPLDKSENDISFVGLDPEEVRRFEGRSANYGQLCPSKCKGIKAKRFYNTCDFQIQN